MSGPACIAVQHAAAASRGMHTLGCWTACRMHDLGCWAACPSHTLQVIAKAKVPIVKFEDAETGYAFDVSFDVANGPEVRFCLSTQGLCAARMHMAALIRPGAMAALLCFSVHHQRLGPKFPRH